MMNSPTNFHEITIFCRGLFTAASPGLETPLGAAISGLGPGAWRSAEGAGPEVEDSELFRFFSEIMNTIFSLTL